MRKYILKDGQPIRCDDVIQWSNWIESSIASGERRVAHDTINGGDLYTSFLGIDHNWDEGEPILYETMFRNSDGSWADFQWRYHTK